MRVILLAISWYLLSLTPSFSQQNQRNNPDNRPKDGRPEDVFFTNVPTHDYDIILCRPTDQSVLVSIVSYKDAEASIVYGIDGKQQELIEIFPLKANTPYEVQLNHLKNNAEYGYVFIYKPKGSKYFTKSKTFYFRTQRAKENSFVFTITADSHLDQNTDTALYLKSLSSALADSADFHVDLGDVFMTDKYRDNFISSEKQYLAQRYYFGTLCHSTPLFLTLGNHDGEMGDKLNDREDNSCVWANKTRKKYFPNPTPNSFYSGDAQIVPNMDLAQDYYSWEWGDALFIVLDPFLYTPRAGKDEPWERTLGKTQYEWLKQTLIHKKTKYCYVFIHNLVGGVDLKGKARGGAEIARFYEWGGQNADSTDGFKQHRPDWDMPIHQLLKKYQVTAVFHGHDHVYAKQKYDGILYQCLPQPGSRRSGDTKHAEEYGYKTGVLINQAGYLRVNVSVSGTKIEFVRAEDQKVLDEYLVK